MLNFNANLTSTLIAVLMSLQTRSVRHPPAGAGERTRVDALQQEGMEEGLVEPEVKIRKGDYSAAREHFHTALTHRGKSPGRFDALSTPAGATEIEFASGPLTLKAWLFVPASAAETRHPAVLFLHGGFAFGNEDWEMAKPFRDAGFVVLAPRLRAENGQQGSFSLLYDEVEDVLAAAEFLCNEPVVDPERLHLAGHSIGGTLALLASMSSDRFRSVASFSASPDQVVYCKLGINEQDIPFDRSDPTELEMRSPLAFAASFKCPVRMYYGSNEPHFHLSTQRTVEIAREHKLDVAAQRITGDHDSAVPEAMRRSIEFFRTADRTD